MTLKFELKKFRNIQLEKMPNYSLLTRVTNFSESSLYPMFCFYRHVSQIREQMKRNWTEEWQYMHHKPRFATPKWKLIYHDRPRMCRSDVAV